MSVSEKPPCLICGAPYHQHDGGMRHCRMYATYRPQQTDDERNRLREALVDIRNRILCPVGPSPTLDEVEAIASAALAADDEQG